MQNHGIIPDEHVLYGSPSIDGRRPLYHENYPNSVLLATRDAVAVGNWVTGPVTKQGGKRKATEVLVVCISAKKRKN